MTPNCRAYDPAFACELAVIVDHGTRRMMQQNADEFYYITVTNENYAQPSLPEGVENDVIRGMYRLRRKPAAVEARGPPVGQRHDSSRGHRSTSYAQGRFVALGTDGFGRSDTRSALRGFFEVDRHHIVIAALDALVREQVLASDVVAKAIKHYGVNTEGVAPWEA